MIHSNVYDKLEFSTVLNFIKKYVYTELGTKIILATEPFESIEDVLRAGKLVTSAKNVLIENEHPPLTYLTDLSEPLARATIEGAILDTKIILDILNLIQTSRKIFSYLKNIEDNTLLNNFSSELFNDKILEHQIERIINENGEIKDNASKELSNIRKEIQDKNENLRKIINKLLKKFKESLLVQEEYITQRDGRLVLPVKSEHKRQVKGFIHSESATGQTVYIEPEEILELNNEIISLGFSEKREIDRILKELTRRIGEDAYLLKRSLRAIAEIDAFFAKAHYSVEILGNFPEINQKGTLRLLNARHPILLKKIGRDKTVPLNIELQKPGVVVITGPNAGGKTVVLKSLGIIYLMVLCGLHIPADPDSNLVFLNNILLDIGDAQSLEDDLSTFSSHLSNIKNIINSSNEKSLVLLDEIGTGTDPDEGAALATNILMELAKRKCYTLATTHLGSLKIAANNFESFQNASMEFDNEEIKPTYVFKFGIPGSSYAFEIAERIGFPKDFIIKAKSFIDEDKIKIEDFITDLEKKSQLYKEKINKIERENARLMGMTNLYKQNLEKLEKEKKAIIKKAKDDAENYLKDVNKKIENAIREIKEKNADKNSIIEAKGIALELKSDVNNFKKENTKKETEDLLNNFQPGDMVTLNDSSTVAKIFEINANKGTALIISGNVKLQVKLKDIQKIKDKKYEQEELKSSYNIRPQDLRIDIRGKRPEEIEYDLLKFLDDAYSSGIERVEILHGKGSGVLKRFTQDILKRQGYVKKFYFANIEFGGEGITIAELE